MERLDFNKKIFGDGLNYTVRKGEKWSTRVDINDMIEVEVPLENGMVKFDGESNEHFPCDALIVDIGTCLFKNIPDKVYRFFHDPKTGKKGLEKLMNDAYGEQLWDNQKVTYIGFVILSSDEPLDE